MNRKGYVSPPVGNQITAVIKNVAKQFFVPEYLRQALANALRAENFTIVKEDNYVYPSPIQEAATLVAILAESSADIHCYVEHGSLTLRLYTCRSPKDGHIVLREFLRALPGAELTMFHEINIDVSPLRAAGDD